VAEGPSARSHGSATDDPGPARSNGRTPTEAPLSADPTALSSDGNAIPPSNDGVSTLSDRPTPLLLSRQAADRQRQVGVVSKAPISYPLQFGMG
jgi:hypothetical protein